MPILNAQNLDESVLDSFNLMYVDEDKFTIHREKQGDNFYFTDRRGKHLDNKDVLDRLQSVAVPPTYCDVIYCEEDNGHLQAIGIDANGNKQYFYHERWETLREQAKFSALYKFGQKIPAFRRVINRHLKSDDFDDALMAAMFRILDKTGMRIGGKKSASKNKTYGLTTLRKKHLEIEGDVVHFSYPAKGGVDVDVTLKDPIVAEILEECEDMRGYELFHYYRSGEKHAMTSTRMNRFLKAHMGDEYSVKDFRTWRFSCLFLKIFMSERKKQNKPTLKSLLEKTSELTGNTPAILQSSYIHPGLIDIAKNPDTADKFLNSNKPVKGLRKNEEIFLHYLNSDHARSCLES